jgi:hypothetical protein
MTESAWSYFAQVVGNVTIDTAARLPSCAMYRLADESTDCITFYDLH